MPRLLILLILAAVALLFLLHATGVVELGWDEPGPDPDAPLPFEYEDPGAAKGKERAAPTLAGASAPRVRTGEGEGGRHGDGPPQGPTGPYELVLIDAQTQAPLEDVEIRTLAGESLGKTDRKGGWGVADASVERLSFLAVKQGYVLHRGIARPEEAQEVALYPGIPIRGRVVRTGSQKPVPEAEVQVWDIDFARAVVATTSDAEGRFLMRAVRPHHPLLAVVRTKDYAPRLSRHLFTKEPPEELILEVGGGGKLEGRVLGEDGKPAKGMAVHLLPAERRVFELRPAPGTEDRGPQLSAREVLRARSDVTHTDAEGAYSFEGVELVRAWRPAVFPAPRQLVRGDTVRFSGDGEIQTVDIRIEAPAALEIGVFDSRGNAMSHADLRIASATGVIEIANNDHWEQGVLKLDGLTPGRVTIRASLPGRRPLASSQQLLSGTTTKATLRWEAGADLKGTVRDRAGRPIWHARVFWTADPPKREVLTMYTDRKGRFEFKDLLAQSGTLAVQARNLPHTRTTYESWKQEGVQPGEAPFDVVLPDGTKIEGRFPDVPKGTVIHSRIDGGTSLGDWPLSRNERGLFRRDGPEPGRPKGSRFYFFARGYAPLRVDDRTPFTSGEVRDLGSLYFEETPVRRGRVIGPDRRPFHGAKVSVNVAGDRRTTRTDVKGAFVLARLPVGRLRVTIEADGHPPTRGWFEQGQGETPKTFRLLAGRRLQVSVKDADGRPADGFRVVVRPRPRNEGEIFTGREQVATVDRRGTAWFTLPIGKYEISTFSDSHPGMIKSLVYDVAAQSRKERRRRGRALVVTLRLNASLR